MKAIVIPSGWRVVRCVSEKKDTIILEVAPEAYPTNYINQESVASYLRAQGVECKINL